MRSSTRHSSTASMLIYLTSRQTPPQSIADVTHTVLPWRMLICMGKIGSCLRRSRAESMMAALTGAVSRRDFGRYFDVEEDAPYHDRRCRAPRLHLIELSGRPDLRLSASNEHATPLLVCCHGAPSFLRYERPRRREISSISGEISVCCGLRRL